MLHPVGRLPESVYWRRRIIMLAALLLTVLLVKGVLLSGGDSNAAAGPQDHPRAAGSPTSTSAAPAATASAKPVSTGSPKRTRTPGPTKKPVPTTKSMPSSKSTPKSTRTKPAAKTTRPKSSAAHKPVPTCVSKSLMLFVGTVRESYRVGRVADLALSVANMSDTTCRAQLGPRVQQALIYRGRDRLWSSNDCYPGSESNVVTMAPGELRRLVIRWSGNSSRPGCVGKRVRLDPGRYTVVGEVGKLSGRGTIVLRG